MWCDRGQKAFLNVDFFKQLLLWLKMSFHRIFFLLSLFSRVLKVRNKHCGKQARHSYLELNMNVV